MIFSLFFFLKVALYASKSVYTPLLSALPNVPIDIASCNSYAWTYRTSVHNKHAVVLYEYTETRSAVHLKAFLEKWTGTYIHCDGYAGYKKLENKTIVDV